MPEVTIDDTRKSRKKAKSAGGKSSRSASRASTKSGKGSKGRKSKSAGAGKKKKGKGGKKKGPRSAPVPKPVADIMSPVAMENLYYIAHGPVMALEFRGFPWPGASGKKKKGGGGKKKKKKK